MANLATTTYKVTGTREAVPKRLWAGDEQRQIEYMILLHDSFKEDEKPQWLTMDEIIDYQKRMLEPVA